MNEWISVEERLPDFDIKILVCDSWNDIFIAELFDWPRGPTFSSRMYNHSELGDDYGAILYWMPLPQPPTS